MKAGQYFFLGNIVRKLLLMKEQLLSADYGCGNEFNLKTAVWKGKEFSWRRRDAGRKPDISCPVIAVFVKDKGELGYDTFLEESHRAAGPGAPDLITVGGSYGVYYKSRSGDLRRIVGKIQNFRSELTKKDAGFYNSAVMTLEGKVFIQMQEGRKGLDDGACMRGQRSVMVWSGKEQMDADL